MRVHDILVRAALLAILAGVTTSCNDSTDRTTAPLDPALVAKGQQIFRHDTFGDERFWTDELRMHEVIETAVSPVTALSVGLKVDSEVLPPGILQQVDLNSPA